MKSQVKKVGDKKQVSTKLGQRVFVGLSGGVDSAVSAALLREWGYKVTGVFIKAWTPPGYACTWREDRRSAMRVAAILNIPFITLDLEEGYKKGVVDYMIEGYKKGRTPNPDVMCNREIKFGAFLIWAEGKGADFIATGHYARRIDGSEKIVDSRKINDLNYELVEGIDKNKDQSYFLWTLRQDQLKHILFPVGHLQKEKVRRLAQKFGLPQATRKDSQGLCFLGQVDMKEFLSKYINTKRGEVLNMSGEVIGHHGGAVFFTIGERHGFTITLKTPNEDPLYVVSKDIVKNTITVAAKNLRPKTVDHTEVWLENVNWVGGEFPKKTSLFCRLRYRQEKIRCSIEEIDQKVKVILKESQYVSSGQSLVFYLPEDRAMEGEICLGGGVIM